MKSKSKLLRKDNARINKADLLALAVCVFLAVCWFASAPAGVTEVDEPMYQVYEARLMRGDRLFYDDWTLTPFTTLFNYAPFAVFYGITGGAEGVLLALRYLFAVLKVLTFVLIYAALRPYGAWAVLASAIFSGAFQFGIKTLNYYYVCGCALLFTGWVLFIKKNAGPLLHVSAGFVFSLAVLAEPSMAAVWIVYSLLVLARRVCRKKALRFAENCDFVLNPCVWRRMLYGVLAAAAVLFTLCAAYFMRVPLAGLRQGFINALNDPERSGRGVGALLAGRLGIIRVYLQIYHPALLLTFLALLPAALIARRVSRRTEPVFIVLLGLLWAALTVRSLTYPMERIGYAVGETVCHPLPLCLLSVVFYCFTERKDRRLFAFMLFWFYAMLCGDMISMTAFGAFSEVGAVPAVLLLRAYYAECRQRAAAKTEAKKKNAKRETEISRAAKLLPAVLTALIAAVAAAELAHTGYLLRLHETERLFLHSDAPLDTVISCGAYRGVRTTAQIAENYEKSVRDAAIIRSVCKNRLYVADLAPSVYLDADVQIAAHSPYYYNHEGWSRVSAWWQMHPEKRPDVVYIPRVSLNYMTYSDATPEEKLAYLRSVAEVEAVPGGEIGDIVRVIRWNGD